MNDDSFVRLVQQRLSDAGHYKGRIDGDAGAGTIAALNKVLPAVVPTMPTLPADDFPKLYGVHPKLAAVVRACSARSTVRFTVIEGLRSKARQAELVAQGASKTMNSRHITGHAVDLWPLDASGNKLPSDAAFPRGSTAAKAADKALWDGLRAINNAMMEAAKTIGVTVTWGGTWKSFPDGPHFEIDPKVYPA